jgi:hypothetical protein
VLLHRGRSPPERRAGGPIELLLTGLRHPVGRRLHRCTNETAIPGRRHVVSAANFSLKSYGREARQPWDRRISDLSGAIVPATTHLSVTKADPGWTLRLTLQEFAGTT